MPLAKAQYSLLESNPQDPIPYDDIVSQSKRQAEDCVEQWCQTVLDDRRAPEGTAYAGRRAKERDTVRFDSGIVV